MNDASNLPARQDDQAGTQSSRPQTRESDLRRGSGRAKLRIRRVMYWVMLFVQPIIFAVTILLLIVAFAVAQRFGFFTSSDVDLATETVVEEGVEYVCPMLCVPPSKKPGRCPVCGMELKPRPISGDPKDRYGIFVEPTARRLANIKTVVAAKVPLTKSVQAFGRISYDETSEVTVSAYVAGRLESLFVDYRGATVSAGDPLAVIYSPELYSAQVELLEAKKAMETSSSENNRLLRTNQQLYASARRRLIEYGLSDSQIEAIEADAEANSRITIYSPASGTVVAKLVAEGSYVKTGEPILRLVDLSHVWLKLELFPEDANLIRYGQQVTVRMQSQPGQEFTGRVAFIDPEVDEKTQTVAVRVVIPNEMRAIRIGDLADATVPIQVVGSTQMQTVIYDPEVAGKWVSPNHPYIIRDEPGTCPECGEPLVPAETLGFVNFQPETQGMVVVPRQAVLFSGDESVAYVETEPGRFEFREVEVGYISDQQVAILDGIEPGENVVFNAAFMIDSAFNMANKPSLIDPHRAAPREEGDGNEQQTPSQLAAIESALATLSDADRELAQQQAICPVTELALGSMGTPIKIAIDGREVMICCEGCRDRLEKNPSEYFAILEKKAADSAASSSGQSVDDEQIALALASLSPADRTLVEQQKFCPVADFRLGAMGTPIKVNVEGEPVFICCEGCRDSLLKEPAKYLAIIEQYKKSGQKLGDSSGRASAHQHMGDDLPQMELPQMELPQMSLPEPRASKSEAGGQ